MRLWWREQAVARTRGLWLVPTFGYAKGLRRHAQARDVGVIASAAKPIILSARFILMGFASLYPSYF